MIKTEIPVKPAVIIAVKNGGVPQQRGLLHPEGRQPGEDGLVVGVTAVVAPFGVNGEDLPSRVRFPADSRRARGWAPLRGEDPRPVSPASGSSSRSDWDLRRRNPYRLPGWL